MHLDNIQQGQQIQNIECHKQELSQLNNKLWMNFVQQIDQKYNKQYLNRCLEYQSYKLDFFVKRVGAPQGQDGFPLFISLHGGGQCQKSVNDQQYNNQKSLYQVYNCIYIACRAPTDTWDLWHLPHIQILFRRLIILSHYYEYVDLNKVYIIGYSAGGDGVYRLGPRLADYLGGACMMAGHPGEASLHNLKNIAFSIHVGELDHAYNRNVIGQEKAAEFQLLQQGCSDSYIHMVHVVKDKHHWMDGVDKEALDWILQFQRNPFPKSVVWHLNNDKRQSFYNLFLANGEKLIKEDQLESLHENQNSNLIIRVNIEGNLISINDNELSDIQLWIYLNDYLVDLDSKITLKGTSGQIYFEQQVERNDECIQESLNEKCDPYMIYYGKIFFQKSINYQIYFQQLIIRI